jgi:hypothetical protein
VLNTISIMTANQPMDRVLSLKLKLNTKGSLTVQPTVRRMSFWCFQAPWMAIGAPEINDLH